MVLIEEEKLKQIIEEAHIQGQCDMKNSGSFRVISKGEAWQHWNWKVKPDCNIVDTFKCSVCDSECLI